MALKSYEELVKVDVSQYCEKRDGFTYLNWAKCIELLRQNGATEVYWEPIPDPQTGSSLRKTDIEFKDKNNNTNRCYETRIKVVIDDKEYEMQTPVMNGANPVKDNSMSQQRVWNSMCRAFVKCVAIHIHAVYDVPGKTSDGEELEDASDEVYDFILCCICPVKLSKPGLTYNGKDERMEERTRDWVVDMPDKGFLFPAFNDRQTDVHSVLYYTRKSAEVQEEMVRELLGIDFVASADGEKDKFGKLLGDVFGEDADCKIVKDIYEGISKEMERHAEDPELYKIDRNELKKIFCNSGVPDEKMEMFDGAYRENIGNVPVMASNICDNKVVNIQVPEGKITIDADFISNLEIKEVDGRKCMVLPVDYVEVNGISTKA